MFSWQNYNFAVTYPLRGVSYTFRIVKIFCQMLIIFRSFIRDVGSVQLKLGSLMAVFIRR